VLSGKNRCEVEKQIPDTIQKEYDENGDSVVLQNRIRKLESF